MAYHPVQIYYEDWIQWIAQFPRLYRLARRLNDYVDLFTSIQRIPQDGIFKIDDVLDSWSSHLYQGSDFGAPALNRTLKVGGYFVIRELLRHKIITKSLAIPHAYAPIDRMQRFFWDWFGIRIKTSKDIHDCLIEHLGADGATFNGDYDIPLRIVAADEGCRVPCDYIPKRSYPLFQAREALRTLRDELRATKCPLPTTPSPT